MNTKLPSVVFGRFAAYRQGDAEWLTFTTPNAYEIAENFSTFLGWATKEIAVTLTWPDGFPEPAPIEPEPKRYA